MLLLIINEVEEDWIANRTLSVLVISLRAFFQLSSLALLQDLSLPAQRKTMGLLITPVRCVSNEVIVTHNAN